MRRLGLCTIAAALLGLVGATMVPPAEAACLTTGSGSVLQNLVDNMVAGEWCVLPVAGTMSMFLQSGTNIVGDATGGVWDNVRKEAHFLGGADSACGPCRMIQAVYVESTNTWTVRTDPLPFTGNRHGWDGNAIDVRGRRHYRVNGLGDQSTWVQNLDTFAWSQIATDPFPSGQQGAAWHPERGSSGQLVVIGVESGIDGALRVLGSEGVGGFTQLGGLLANIGSNAFAEYSEIYKVTIFGGEAGGIYRLDARGTVTAMPAAPCQIRQNREGILHADPATGDLVLLCPDVTWHKLNPTGAGSWTTQPAPGGIANHVLNFLQPELGRTWGKIGVPVSTHGAIMYVACDYGSCGTYLYKSSAWTAADRDFTQRCYAAGVVTCYHFDTAAEIAGVAQIDPQGTYSGTPTIDTTKASGAGAVKFTIPAGQSGGAAGAVFINNRLDYSGRFGPNTNFYVQWRDRMDANYVAYQGPGGVAGKQWNLGRGSTGSGAAGPAPSCNSLELGGQNNSGLGMPQMYFHCPGTGHVLLQGAPDLLQNARPSPFCNYNDGPGGGNPSSFFFNGINGNCIPFFSNEWATFTMHVTVGPRVGDTFQNSRIELWYAHEGQASIKLIDLVLDLTNIDQSSDCSSPCSGPAEYGQMHFTNFVTGGEVSSTGAMRWIDEYIVSTLPIADPGAPADTTPPTAPLTPVATPISATQIALTWTAADDNVGVTGYRVERCQGVGCVTFVQVATPTGTAVTDTGLQASTPYSYRMRAIDAAGNPGPYSATASATTQAASVTWDPKRPPCADWPFWNDRPIASDRPFAPDRPAL